MTQWTFNNVHIHLCPASSLCYFASVLRCALYYTWLKSVQFAWESSLQSLLQCNCWGNNIIIPPSDGQPAGVLSSLTVEIHRARVPLKTRSRSSKPQLDYLGACTYSRRQYLWSFTTLNHSFIHLADTFGTAPRWYTLPDTKRKKKHMPPKEKTYPLSQIAKTAATKTEQCLQIFTQYSPNASHMECSKKKKKRQKRQRSVHQWTCLYLYLYLAYT